MPQSAMNLPTYYHIIALNERNAVSKDFAKTQLLNHRIDRNSVEIFSYYLEK